jgi:hypothetical protein
MQDIYIPKYGETQFIKSTEFYNQTAYIGGIKLSNHVLPKIHQKKVNEFQGKMPEDGNGESSDDENKENTPEVIMANTHVFLDLEKNVCEKPTPGYRFVYPDELSPDSKLFKAA